MASIFPEQRGHLESPVVPRNDRPEDGSSTPGDFSVTLPGIVYLLGSQVWLPFWRQGAVLKGPVRSTVSFDASVTCFLAAVTHPCVAQEGRVYSVSQLRVPSIGQEGHGGQEGEAVGHIVHTVRRQRDETPFLFSPRDGINDGIFSLKMQHEYVPKCVS